MTFRRALSIGLLALLLVCAVIVLSGCKIFYAPNIDPRCPTYGGCNPLDYPAPGLDLNGYGVMP